LDPRPISLRSRDTAPCERRYQPTGSVVQLFGLDRHNTGPPLAEAAGQSHLSSCDVGTGLGGHRTTALTKDIRGKRKDGAARGEPSILFDVALNGDSDAVAAL
jgi:hypothetical protein